MELELSVDLMGDPMLLACSGRAQELLAIADDEYPRVRGQADRAVVDWSFSREDAYPLLDPIGPELWGGSRGVASSEPVDQGYAYGLSSDGEIRVKRRSTAAGASTQYQLPGEEAGEVLVWSFSERDDLGFHRCQGVSVSRRRVDGVRLVVFQNGHGDERRSAFVVSPAEVRLHAVSMKRGRAEPEEQYVATLDGQGRPLRIVDPRTGATRFERERRGDPGEMLTRLQRELLRIIPGLVERWAKGREVDGVCLLHGDGVERFPPAVLPVLSEGPERARLEIAETWQVWEPSRWLDVVDPIYFDRGVSTLVDELSADLAPWLRDEATQGAALEAIDDLARKLGRARWPGGLARREPFVVYRANYEEDDWRPCFRAALASAEMAALEQRGALPPDFDE